MGNWKLHHIAIVVEDIDSTVQYYESLGIAKVGREVVFPEANPNIRAKFVEIGSVPIELIQPIEGESSNYQEFLDRNGEGLNHIAFTVANFDEEAAILEEKGAPITVKGKAPAAFGRMSAHFDTRHVGKFGIQLIQEAE